MLELSFGDLSQWFFYTDGFAESDHVGFEAVGLGVPTRTAANSMRFVNDQQCSILRSELVDER